MFGIEEFDLFLSPQLGRLERKNLHQKPIASGPEETGFDQARSGGSLAGEVKERSSAQISDNNTLSGLGASEIPQCPKCC